MILLNCTHNITDHIKKQRSKKISREGEVKIMTGFVKWFNNEKGFGFIDYKPNKDVFVHYSAIKMEGYKTLTEGDYVTFKIIETGKGLQAVDVILIKQKEPMPI